MVELFWTRLRQSTVMDAEHEPLVWSSHQSGRRVEALIACHDWGSLECCALLHRIAAMVCSDARRPTIAVMPFANVGGEKEQEYFADGITEDIITALGRFRWFLVIARNSSFVYKDKPIDSKQIARELSVQYLVEGSVRKSGRAVRISARLVDPTTGARSGPSATIWR